MLWRVSIAFLLLGLTVSATATIPLKIPSIAIYIGVFPSLANLSESFDKISISIFFSVINFLFPSKISFPSILTSIPWPGIASNASIALSSKFFSSASLTIASPNGCSDPFSALAAKIRISSFEMSLVIISVTTGLPSVIVPVLSKTIVLIL